MSEEESQSQYGQYSSDDNQSDAETNSSSPEGSSAQQQLILAQKYFDQDNYEDAESQLDKIQTDDKREKYSILILRAFISLKKENMDQFESYVIQASKEQRQEILPYKIRIYNNRSLDELNQILTSMFDSKVKPDLEIMKLISPKIHKMAKQYKKIAESYFDAIRADKSLLPAINYIIPTKYTIGDRIDVLTKYSKDDMEACVLLIKIYIKEIGAVDKATPYIGYLPKDHPTRLLFKVLFGAHPVEEAKELCSQKDNDQHFRDFIKFYEEKNFISLQRFVQNEPYFASGWILLSQLTDDIPSKCVALKKANEIFFKKEILNQLEELEGTCVIQDDNGEDIAITSSPKDRQELFEAKRFFDNYKKSKDKTVLKPILEMGNNFLIQEIKIEAILELEDEIGTEEMMLKLESIKETKYRKIYNVIGHLHLKRGNKEEALNNFIEDAKFGSNDPVCLELVSRKFIQDNEIEKALELCLKAPYYEWAIFRCGLIYQRLKNNEEAVKMFYKIIRNRQNLSSLTTTNSTDSDGGQNSRSIFVDENIKIESVWKVIAQSYAAMNRYMALKDVLSELRRIGNPDLDYESLYNVFHEKNFGSVFSYDIKSSPLQYHNFLRKILSDIKMLKWQGRIDSCLSIIEKYESLVVESLEKWGKLGAILKSSADFFLEGFILSDNQNREMYQRSLECYKSRAEIDKVPESIVDLANLFHVDGKDELALTFLKKSLTKFSNSQLVWFNIGILYALSEKFPLARHCFIVASKISFDSQNGKIFSYMAAVEQAMNDIEMMEKAIRAAEEMNSMDVSLLQIKSVNGLLNPFDAAMSIYEGEFISPELPCLCLKRGKFLEALGFALMLNSNDEIALAYEALGKYDQALQFAEDEELIDRLNKLSELKSSPSEKSYSPDEINSAIKKYKEGEDLFSKLTTAALYISKNDKSEAYSILKSLLERSRNKSKKKTENVNENSSITSNEKSESTNENDNNNNNNNNSNENNNNNNENDSSNNDNNNNNENANNNNNNENDNNNNENDNNNNNANANDNNNDGNEKVDDGVGDSKRNGEAAAENDSSSSRLLIPKRFIRLILLWLIQVAPKDDNSITHKMIGSDPLLFFMNAKRSVGECKAAVKMYHKFMNTSSFALKLFLVIALKSNDKVFNMAQIIGAAENLVSISPSRDSYKFLISAKIKDKKYKEAMDAIQRLQILDPNEIKQYSELFNQLKSLA